MKKIIKVPCFCNVHCSGGIVTEFSFVQRATRNLHEKRDITAEARRTAYCNVNGVPQQESVQPDNDDMDICEDDFSWVDNVDFDIETEDDQQQEEYRFNEEEEQAVNEDEYPEEEDFTYSPVYGNEPVSYIFTLMILMMHGKYLTQEGCELVMIFFNIILTYLNLDYRFPKNLSTFISRMKYQETFYQGMKKYTSCKKCHSIYPLSDDNETREHNSRCTFATRVSSTTGRTLLRCDTELYSINRNNGKLTPTRVFIYNSIISTLKQFFSREGFMDSITSWKNRKLQAVNYMFDIMDAKVWKTFKISPTDNVPFFEESLTNLGFSLNVDWYQGYSNSVYSVGAIYMTILNMDRKLRNLKKNVIFVGLMPGPKESKLQQTNHYLEPLINELKTLMGAGIKMKTATGEVLVRAAVILGSLDLPAAAKVFGFSAHNSFYGCRKCHYKMPSIDGDELKRDYSGGWDNNWPKRTDESNRRYAMVWKRAINEAERQRLVQSNGTRWSVFHDLPYFNLIRFVVFDPMHNVWLGTCKRMIIYFVKHMKYFSNSDLDNMAEMTSNIVMPFGFDISSMARKITTGDGFAYFKADEWRVFSLFLSPLLFKSLPSAVYNNWMTFISALQVMSMPNITVSDALACHEKIVLFCKEYEELYGKENLVANMHYHIHLYEQMLDFGPWHSHHAFGYERFNMDLKCVKTNHKGSIETTVAKKFLQLIHREDYFAGSFPNMGPRVSIDELKSAFLGNNIHGNRKQYEDAYLKHELEMARENDSDLINFVEYGGNIDQSGLRNHAYGFEPLPESTVLSITFHKTARILKDDDYNQLLDYYKVNLNPEDSPYIVGKDEYVDLSRNNVKVDPRIVKFNSISILGQKYNTREATSARGSYIQAYFRDNNQNEEDYQLRPAQIQYFFRHSLQVMNNENTLETATFTFAYVRWYKDLNIEAHVTTFDSINTKCISNTFIDRSYMDILPVHCIHSPIGMYINKLANCNIVINLPRRIVE